MAPRKPGRKNTNRANKTSAKNAASQGAGQVRIIAGKYRGRKLPVLNAEGLRPTTDRVKETVFNWLMPYVAQSVCLDSCAGSGSLGFEALSRGAEHVTFVELEGGAAKNIGDNIARLNDSHSEVRNQNMLTLTSDKRFDLVFIDPPFNKGLASQIADYLEQQQLLADDAIIYVETEQNFDAAHLPENWQLLKEKTAGQVVSRLYQR
ncbi:16S rRNA (guanine(966)-N(2))-methyltransferase RsmD [Thalassotalea sp. PS06]|uniref:16S rRNA (guanine(966)-N(2))-methyltransferase RsmD n=1 Tax=Thalassotalea sp. PS06 TaxID=2594005 RepID=UPI001163109F|nr:16S rRNA (guanine(966)-N(2))-methyltransferase RsmD [Thalassotalea sp. PS06]QDP02671.1 16S rRNA (guanine(966)-N(2))-methyltransferase RsmD [Thalassotalea sp. PS06]